MEAAPTAQPEKQSLFTLESRKDYGILRFPPIVDQKAGKELAELTDKGLAEPFKVLILDFERVQKLEQIVFRPLVLLHQGLKKKSGGMYTVNIAHEILQIIQGAGLDSVFSPKVNLPDALSSAGVKASGVIDVNFINPFVAATQNTIKTAARTELKAGRPFLKSGRLDNEMDIAGVISMCSNAFQGSIALCFPAPVFLLIYSNMMGKPCTSITREAEDAAGELLNIIFGQAKGKFAKDRKYVIHEAVPTVIKGSDLSVRHSARRAALVIPFETEAGVFHIEISADAA
jgi:chemotaxis protein CheX